MTLQHLGSPTVPTGLLAHRALAHDLPLATRSVADAAPPMNETVRRAVAAAPERAAAGPKELREHALLADDVYNDTPNPPAGYRVADLRDLQALRLDPEDLSKGSFRARVYVTGSGDRARYTIAFRGTQEGSDWGANLQQIQGKASVHYQQALRIAQNIKDSPLVGKVDFTGHSLGGGLASAAAVASGRPADTFNAAGLHDNTIAQANDVRGGGTAGRVDAWYVSGEVLSALQDGGDRMIGVALGGLLGDPRITMADAPGAYGTRHELDAVRPAGAGRLDGLNPVAKHGMDWVLSSLPR